MASSSSISLLLLFFFLAISSSVPLLPPDEQESAYLVLESINPEINWRSLFPDDLCISAPHGVVCDYEDNSTAAAHIAELSFGYISDYSSNPSCGGNPHFTPRISSFPFLRKLLFYECFTGAEETPLPEYLWNLSSSLEELVFVQNPSLVGAVDGRIAGFSRLRRLVVSESGISGEVPASIGELQELEQLVITRSRLSGELPESVRKLEKLKILDLSYNRLVGNIPAWIGETPNLIKLDLGFNQMQGRIPDQLVGLQKLEFLDLSYNRLSNSGIPVFLAEMRGLREVYLSGNPLGGRIPEIWRNLGGLLGIGLSGLGLVGKIPGSMGVFLQKVCYVGLDNNMLEGEVPVELGMLESVKEMNLENNRLSGEVHFSANFSGKKMKLKLGGNPGLCVNSGRMEGHIGDLKICSRKAARPDAVVLSSSVPLLHPSSFLYVFLILVLIFQL